MAGQLSGRLGSAFERLFDLNGEGNVPTWFSSCLLLICSALSGLIGVRERARAAEGARYWLGLSLIFLFLSLDETASIHEKPDYLLRRTLGTTGFFHFAWVIPAIVLVAAFGLLYLRFVLKLPAATRRLLVWAGLIYIGGAVGMEMVGGYFISAREIQQAGKELIATKGADPMLYILTLEETLEMIGLATCVYALLSHIQHYLGIVYYWPPSVGQATRN
ncbi:MAG: hypothetical protein WD696_09460 [Bryobacteraceae bacterium]